MPDTEEMTGNILTYNRELLFGYCTHSVLAVVSWKGFFPLDLGYNLVARDRSSPPAVLSSCAFGATGHAWVAVHHLSITSRSVSA